MLLFEKIQKILFEKSLGVNDFIEKTKFSNNLYYKIKSGEKDSLTPKQAKRINEIFPEYSYEWLLDVDSTDDSNEGFISIEKSIGIGVYLKDNHERLMKEDPTYALFMDKIGAEIAIEKLLKSSKQD